MADLAAQREARRRKITENAEARMTRLLGLTKKSDENNELPAQNFVFQNHDNEEPAYNTRLRSHGSVAPASPSRQIPASVASNATTDRSSNMHLDDHVHIRPKTADTKVIDQDVALQPPIGISELTANRTDASSSGIVPGRNAKTVEIIRVVILVVTALLARLVLKLDIGLVIVQSIFVPFIILEMAFEYVIFSYPQHVQLFTSKGNIMSAALMLCGMKQDILDTYNKIMAHITSWSSDFCVYIFSFIVWITFIA